MADSRLNGVIRALESGPRVAFTSFIQAEVESAIAFAQSDNDGVVFELEHNPWDDIERKYPVGANVKAEVKSLANYGAFVELEPGVPGLIHISDLSWIKKVSHPSEVLKGGDFVDTVILAVDKEKKQITLGIKQLSQNPWETIEKTMSVGSLVRGKISKITGFGAFVELDNGIEGLIHVSELSDKPFGKIEDVVARGDAVVAKVIEIDPERRKIALSIKRHLLESSQENYDDIVVSGSKGGTKRRATREKAVAHEEGEDESARFEGEAESV